MTSHVKRRKSASRGRCEVIDLDIVTLAASHAEDWLGDGDDGYQCRGCTRDMYLSPELEPRGLCDTCVSETLAAVPDVIEQLRAELAKHERCIICSVALINGDCPVHGGAGVSARKQIADYEAERCRYMPIVEAAKAWARFGRDDSDDENELLKAIDAAGGETK